MPGTKARYQRGVARISRQSRGGRRVSSAYRLQVESYAVEPARPVHLPPVWSCAPFGCPGGRGRFVLSAMSVKRERPSR